MSILVVGSVAFDTVKTPFGAGNDLLGGSATHFAVAASFFAPVRLVAVVGEDFGDEYLEPFRERGVDLEGLERVPGRTFFDSQESEVMSDFQRSETLLSSLADARSIISNSSIPNFFSSIRRRRSSSSCSISY